MSNINCMVQDIVSKYRFILFVKRAKGGYSDQLERLLLKEETNARTGMAGLSGKVSSKSFTAALDPGPQ